jgi:hypothetical protein
MCRQTRYLLTLTSAVVLALSPANAAAAGARGDAVVRLAAVAPGLDGEVLAVALRAHAAAGRAGKARRPILAVVDFSRPSSVRRLWVLDLDREALLFHERVAHGRGSGVGSPTVFSNASGSHASSLGVFVTAETYVGRHGISLRLDGLEPGVNDAARARAIVVHGASYVTEAFVAENGRAGRSHGCPAVDPAVASRLIDALAGGAVLVAYYPDPSWLSASPFLRDAAPPRGAGFAGSR